MGKAFSRENHTNNGHSANINAAGSLETKYKNKDHEIITLILGYIRDIERDSKIYSPPDITELIIIFTSIHNYNHSQLYISLNINSQLDFCDVSFSKKIVSWLNATIIAKKKNLETVPKSYEKYITEGYDNKNMTETQITNSFGLLIHFDGFPMDWDDYYRWIFIENKSMTNAIICSCFGECKYTNIHRIASYNTQSKGGKLDINYEIYGTPFKNIVGLITNYNDTSNSFIHSLIQCLYNGPIEIYQYIKNQYTENNNNNVTFDLFTLFAIMKSNEYQVVATDKLCHNIRNKYNFQLQSKSCGIYQIDEFLKWLLQQVFAPKDNKDNATFCGKLWVKKKCETCHEIKYDQHIQTPYISLPINFNLANVTKKFYVYDLNVNNYTLFEYMFNAKDYMRLKDVKNAVCKLHKVDNTSLVYYFTYNTNNKKFVISDIDSSNHHILSHINGCIIVKNDNNDQENEFEEKYTYDSIHDHENMRVISVLMENKNGFPFPICLKAINEEITTQMIYDQVYKILYELFNSFDCKQQIINKIPASVQEWDNKTPFTLQLHRNDSWEVIKYAFGNIINAENKDKQISIMICWKRKTEIIENIISKSKSDIGYVCPKYRIKFDFENGYIVDKIEEKYDKYSDKYYCLQLSDCFDEYIHNNVVFEYGSKLCNCVKHNNNENDSMIFKQSKILSLPNILFINLQRDYGNNGLKQKVSFPINDNILDFKKYSFSGGKKYKYYLFGVICWNKTSDEFYAYIFAKELKEWYRIKDSNVRKSCRNEIIFREDHVCVLCYHKIQ